jgi:hypothetical protein
VQDVQGGTIRATGMYVCVYVYVYVCVYVYVYVYVYKYVCVYVYVYVYLNVQGGAVRATGAVFILLFMYLPFIEEL